MTWRVSCHLFSLYVSKRGQKNPRGVPTPAARTENERKNHAVPMTIAVLMKLMEFIRCFIKDLFVSIIISSAALIKRLDHSIFLMIMIRIGAREETYSIFFRSPRESKQFSRCSCKSSVFEGALGKFRVGSFILVVWRTEQFDSVLFASIWNVCSNLQLFETVARRNSRSEITFVNVFNSYYWKKSCLETFPLRATGTGTVETGWWITRVILGKFKFSLRGSSLHRYLSVEPGI